MKRIIAAFVLILISIAVGITQISLVNCTADRTINNLNRIEKLVKSNKVRRAEKLAEKTAKDFESFSSTYLYCFYRHDDLSVISDSIYSSRITSTTSVSRIFTRSVISEKNSSFP